MELNQEEFVRIFAIFKEESKEHIQHLNEGFLSLERDPSQLSLLSELFRHAHSIKGSARMMGFTAVEKVAHAMETVLGKLQKGELLINKEIASALYRGVDFLSEIIEGILEEKDEKDIRFEEIMQVLGRTISSSKKEEAAPSLEVTTNSSSSPHHEQDHGVPPPVPAVEPPPKIQERNWERRKNTISSASLSEPIGRRKTDLILHETIRVATKKLDNLMNQIGELLVTKIKCDQRLHETKSLMNDSADLLALVQRLQKGGVPSAEDNPCAEKDLRQALLNKIEGSVLAFDQKLHLLYQRLAEDRNQLSFITDELQTDIKKTRMLPFFTAVEVMPRMVRDLAQEGGKKAQLIIEGGEVELDKNILENIKEPLIHLIRNAIDHGIELPEEREKKGKPAEGTITIRASQQGDSVLVEITDDGAGIQIDQVKKAALKRNLFTPQQLEQMNESQLYNIIFQSGFSTSRIVTDISGRGVGMDIVRTNIEKLKGLITVESQQGRGTSFSIKLPLTIVTLPILKIRVRRRIYSIPISSVETTVEVCPEQIFTIEGQEVINYHHRPIPLIPLEDILEITFSDDESEEKKRPAVILGSAEKRVAFLVDTLVGEDVVVAKPLSTHLERVRNISGATILGNGEISLILNVSDLIESAQFRQLRKRKEQLTEAQGDVRKSILVIEDSVTTRTLEVSILESAGYDVVAAGDGQEGYSRLINQPFDLIVTDVQMPLMDGFTFTQKVKSDQRYQHIPIILLTSLESPAEKRRGVEVGADAYIVKNSFDQNNLLDTIRRLL